MSATQMKCFLHRQHAHLLINPNLFAAQRKMKKKKKKNLSFTSDLVELMVSDEQQRIYGKKDQDQLYWFRLKALNRVSLRWKSELVKMSAIYADHKLV